MSLLPLVPVAPPVSLNSQILNSNSGGTPSYLMTDWTQLHMVTDTQPALGQTSTQMLLHLAPDQCYYIRMEKRSHLNLHHPLPLVSLMTFGFFSKLWCQQSLPENECLQYSVQKSVTLLACLHEPIWYYINNLTSSLNSKLILDCHICDIVPVFVLPDLLRPESADKIDIKIADLGNACWVVSDYLTGKLILKIDRIVFHLRTTRLSGHASSMTS